MFKVGDVVQLKSGGPLMTVIVVDYPDTERETINVVWFNSQNDICYETVKAFALEKMK
jgi:uncharacterized protein YodC (DUF2158 family)